MWPWGGVGVVGLGCLVGWFGFVGFLGWLCCGVVVFLVVIVVFWGGVGVVCVWGCVVWLGFLLRICVGG